MLERAVDAGTFDGISAAVIVGDTGRWSAATGVDLQGDRLTPTSPLIIASIGKTVTAAQVMRLAERGTIGLDDPAAEHLPPELHGYDANRATIREMLGMRSGIDAPGPTSRTSMRGPRSPSSWRVSRRRCSPLARATVAHRARADGLLSADEPGPRPPRDAKTVRHIVR
ncbi:MAG: serine hydrolase domain-containing protein [Actinomycetota bacterium]